MASIRKLPGGRWQAQFRPVPGGKQVTRTTRRKVDAQRWLDDQTASLMRGNFVDPNAGRITFGRYFEEWATRQVWTTGTNRAMHLAARSTTFWDLPMRMLVRSHIETWVKEMQMADRGEDKPPGLAPGTIRTRVNNVRSVLRAAVRDRVISSDPSEGVRLPRVREADVAMVLPTPAEIRALLDAADPYFRPFVALCAFAGLRLGEAAALKVGDLRLAERRLIVRRQVQRSLGHSNATVTLNTYAHLWPTAEDRTRTAATAMLADVDATADEPLTNDDAA